LRVKRSRRGAVRECLSCEFFHDPAARHGIDLTTV